MLIVHIIVPKGVVFNLEGKSNSLNLKPKPQTSKKNLYELKNSRKFENSEKCT